MGQFGVHAGERSWQPPSQRRFARIRTDHHQSKHGRPIHAASCYRAGEQSDILVAARLASPGQEINPQEQHRLTTVVFTIAIADLLAKKSWRAFSLHLKGVGALIEACGPPSLVSQFAIDQFYAYRAVLVPFCFLDRRPSFVCRREWISFPLRNESEIKYPALEKLVDIILKIPVLIQKFDEQVTSEDPRKPLLQLLERARVVCQDMESWETDGQLEFPWTKPSQRTLFPLREFQVSGHMQFSGTLTANLASFYLGAKVAIHDLCLSILAKLGNVSDGATATEAAAIRTAVDHTRLWSARAIRCVNSSRELEPRTVGKLVCLFPLDMAWAAYRHLRRSHDTEREAEIRRCEELALGFETTGLPPLRRD